MQEAAGRTLASFGWHFPPSVSEQAAEGLNCSDRSGKHLNIKHIKQDMFKAPSCQNHYGTIKSIMFRCDVFVLGSHCRTKHHAFKNKNVPKWMRMELVHYPQICCNQLILSARTLLMNSFLTKGCINLINANKKKKIYDVIFKSHFNKHFIVSSYYSAAGCSFDVLNVERLVLNIV